MLRGTSWMCLSLILAGWLTAAPAVLGQGKNDPPRKVNDEAGLFSKKAITEANDEVAAIKRTYHKDVLIETREKGPPKDKFHDWAEEQAKEHRVNGIYIVITKDPKHFEVLVGNETIRKGFFTVDDRTKVKQTLHDNLGKQPDEALLKSVEAIRKAFERNAPNAQAEAAPAHPAVHPEHGVAHPSVLGGLFSGIGGIICVGLVVLLVVWVVIALIRAMSGGVGGAGYGAPGYGGGGGGFFPSLLGGMFGAAAGMWMYDHFFGGHSGYSDYGASHPTSTDYGNAPADQPTDAGSGYSGDGGDYGDQGGGGGDWGGGGDGGGDFGGGGGDFGGGGGDW
jgi:uncharacterized membrane protein YgcG